jgi:hypothetical protein
MRIHADPDPGQTLLLQKIYFEFFFSSKPHSGAIKFYLVTS